MPTRAGGIILCGGKSTRMGQPKEWLRVDGEYALARVARVVGGACSPVVVAGRAGQELPPLPEKVGVVCDSVADGGPLAGVLAGLGTLAGEANAAFVTPCDHVWLRTEFVAALIDRLGEANAVVVMHAGRLFPLVGVFRVGLRSLLREQLRLGEKAARRFAERAGAMVVDSRELREADPEGESLRNVNEASDL